MSGRQSEGEFQADVGKTGPGAEELKIAVERVGLCSVVIPRRAVSEE